MTTKVNHLSSAGPPIPEMREAVLSYEDVRVLALDLQSHTQRISVICTGSPRQQTPSTSVPLEAAVEQLLARQVSAIQIRYSFDGHDWTDTLLPVAQGIRLVRCQHLPLSPPSL